MSNENYNDISKALNQIVSPILGGFVAKTLIEKFGAKYWWQRGIMQVLYDYQKKNLPTIGTYEELTDKLDVQRSLMLMSIHWQEIFREKFLKYPNYFNIMKEAETIRNTWAHSTDLTVFSDDFTTRALDTLSRLCAPFDEESAAEIRDMWRQKFYSSTEPPKIAEVEVEEPELPKSTGKFKRWSEVMQIYPAVANVSFQKLDFAADLGRVFHGEGEPEYIDAREFFERTFLTEGLKNLLVQALRRLSGNGGDAVIQLKTSFGGGKTHSMLALYHLFSGKVNPSQSGNVEKVLSAANMSEVPKARVVVISGEWLNIVKSEKNLTSTKATIWGEIAAQLTKPTDDEDFYEYMRAADEMAISPGVEALRNLFDAAGTCLILIDELVAYGRKLRNEPGLPAGTFDNFMSFIQELTQAARASKSSMVVATLPESEDEAGGEQGLKILSKVEKVFGRVEAVWKPVTPEEGFEIVRRRLFVKCLDEAERDRICSAFCEMYRNNGNTFPFASRQANYKQRMINCYPIHPELFEYLYNKWSAINGFQKTRGVLRFMANVIYQLWLDKDESCLIMPGSLPLSVAQVHDELTKYLGDNWNSLIESEVDGVHSLPFMLDRENQRFGKISAARRITRTIFIGSAPDSASSANIKNNAADIRGIDESYVFLGVVDPQEKNPSVFAEAISKLKGKLIYLYSDNNRLWFNIRPTLRKYVKDMEENIPDYMAIEKIENSLKSFRKVNEIVRLIICPKKNADIDDEQGVQLIVLPPEKYYERNNDKTYALQVTYDILSHRGNVPRQHKNMLLFLAADEEQLRSLKKTCRRLIAWEKIKADYDSGKLELDRTQSREMNNSIKDVQKILLESIALTYRWIIVPESDLNDANKMDIEILEIECKDSTIERAVEKLVSKNKIAGKYAPTVLVDELDEYIWRNRDSVDVQEIWRCHTDYYYMPRLRDESVFYNCVRRGVAENFFALADSFDAKENRYENLVIGEKISGQLAPTALIVKKAIAEKQIRAENPELDDVDDDIDDSTSDSDSDIINLVSPQPPPKKKQFTMQKVFDDERALRNLKNTLDEVIIHLTKSNPSNVMLYLEVDIKIPEGVPANVEKIVSENCKALKIDDFKFE